MSDKLSLSIQEQVERGISILKQGGIVAFPTDTVYGLGACVSIHQAVERVYAVKERPRNMALPLLLADTSQITKVANYVPPIAWLLIDNFLPGALTIVLQRSNSVPDIITGGGATVAVNKIDLVIDGGRCPGGKESTIVDVTGETPVILREGAISREEIERVCGKIMFREETR